MTNQTKSGSMSLEFLNFRYSLSTWSDFIDSGSILVASTGQVSLKATHRAKNIVEAFLVAGRNTATIIIGFLENIFFASAAFSPNFEFHNSLYILWL